MIVVKEIEWIPIKTPPHEDEEVLGYGFYIYPGDTDRTEYWEVAIYCPSANQKYPWSGENGEHLLDHFTHYARLTSPKDVIDDLAVDLIAKLGQEYDKE